MGRISIPHARRRDALRFFARERRRDSGDSSVFQGQESRAHDAAKRKRIAVAEGADSTRTGPRALANSHRWTARVRYAPILRLPLIKGVGGSAPEDPYARAMRLLLLAVQHRESANGIAQSRTQEDICWKMSLERDAREANRSSHPIDDPRNPTVTLIPPRED